MNFPDQTANTQLQERKALLDAVICAACLAVFAYVVTGSFPLKTIALLPLSIVAFVMYIRVKRKEVSIHLLYPFNFSSVLFRHIVLAVFMAIAGVFYYRGSLGMPVLPVFFRLFCLVAAGIGITEELMFRGFIQGRLSNLHPLKSIILAALAQAVYKASLFLSPGIYFQSDLLRFFIVSFLAFILLGLLRYTSKSILPAIITHAIFDVLVYAESQQAPWWVW